MRQDATSLDRLHDIVLPPEVSWWPLAPGWYALLALAAVVAGWLAWRAWRRWRADAYRRAALRELAALDDAPAIAELLRRTALAVTPRAVVAARSGAAWADWLASRCAAAMPDAVRRQISAGIYARPSGRAEIEPLRDYAARWIASHARTPAADSVAAGREREAPSC